MTSPSAHGDASAVVSTATGWRLWSITPAGKLVPPFRRARNRPMTSEWNRAVCDLHDHAEWPREYTQQLREAFYRTDAHDVAADDCGCGWRFYRTLGDLIEGCRAIPSGQTDDGRLWGVPVLTARPVAVARVEVGGRIAGRHRLRGDIDGGVEGGNFASHSELHTLRAEYMRIVDGPVVIPGHLPKAASAGLKRTFGSRLRRVPGFVFPALINGTITRLVETDSAAELEATGE